MENTCDFNRTTAALLTLNYTVVQIPISLIYLDKWKMQQGWWFSQRGKRWLKWVNLYSLDFMGSHFSAYMEAFAFHFITLASGIFGNLDHSIKGRLCYLAGGGERTTVCLKLILLVIKVMFNVSCTKQLDAQFFVDIQVVLTTELKWILCFV